jgi:NADH dehydrogenase
MAEVSGVDVKARTVTDGKSTLHYDYLVLATGAVHSYFGHDAWAAYAPGLKTLDDAATLRERLLLAFERSELSNDPAAQDRQMTTVIIGGGPTGVELAGAVAELTHKTFRGEFRKIDPATARIVLVEAGPRLLATFPERLSEVTRQSLEAMQVEVRTGTAVTACDERGVVVGDGERIKAATVVWAAGVTASPAAAWTGAPHDRVGRVQVKADLSLPGHPEIFAIGDTASLSRPDGSLVPGVAPAAKQMGRYVGSLIASRVAGRAVPRPFRYHHNGDLATIGRSSAVVSAGPLRLTGFLGWLFWSMIHIWFLIGFRSRIVVSINWLWSYVSYQRSARLILDRRDPAG